MAQIKVASVDWIKIISKEEISVMVMVFPCSKFISFLFKLRSMYLWPLFCRKEPQKVLIFWLEQTMEVSLTLLRCLQFLVFIFLDELLKLC